MINTVLTSVAVLAFSAVAQGAGSAIVINQCSYPVTMANVPASGGGQSEIGPNTLNTGDSYSQQYTQLSNGDGWSIKLAKDSSMSQVMQYEYTYHNDGTIWFDLSDVNGDPWGGDWVISGSGDCSPKQTAYQFSTDDAYGMQSCSDSSSVTVTLCSGGSGGSTGGESAAASSPASTATSAAPAASSTWQGGAGGDKVADIGNNANNNVQEQVSTTLATHVKGHAAHTVTNIHTEVVTKFVHASPAPKKREEHMHRHMAHHQH